MISFFAHLISGVMVGIEFPPNMIIVDIFILRTGVMYGNPEDFE